jgi:NADPH-dependent curcumin reductase CurA
MPPNDTARPSQVLGVVGMPAFTACWRLTAIGQPQADETPAAAARGGSAPSPVRWEVC